jgi:hypothetical protein
LPEVAEPEPPLTILDKVLDHDDEVLQAEADAVGVPHRGGLNLING